MRTHISLSKHVEVVPNIKPFIDLYNWSDEKCPTVIENNS